MPALLTENLLAWDVLLRAYNGRQFEFIATTAALPMGGTITKSVPVAFKYEAVLRLIEFMVPCERRLEVLNKFQWVESYALNKAAGGGGG